MNTVSTQKEKPGYNHVTLVGNVVSVDAWYKNLKVTKITITIKVVHAVKKQLDNPEQEYSLIDVEMSNSISRLGLKKLKSFHKPGTRILIDGSVEHVPNDMMKIIASEIVRLSPIKTKKEK